MSPYDLPFLLGYNTNGFLAHRIEDVADILAELKYRSIAITLDVHHLDPFTMTREGLRRLRGRLERRHLVPAIETGARYILDPRRRHFPTLLSDSGASLRADYLERSIRVAEALGSRVVSFWTGDFASGSPDEGFRRLEASLRPLVGVARRAGVAMALEPEPKLLIETFEQYRRFKERSGLADLRLTLDTGHLRCSETLAPAEVIRLAGGDLVNVHLDDNDGPEHRHLVPGEGDLPWGEILGALRAADFRGVASVELSRHSHVAPETAARVMRFFEDLLAAESG